MKTILSYKTETSGLPDWRGKSNAEHQPHLVRLSAMLYNQNSGEMIDYFDVIIKPEGWVIPEEAIISHHITNSKAAEVGISEQAAFDLFMGLFVKGEDCARISPNKAFDSRIMRIASKRFGTVEQQELLNNKENNFCAVSMYKDAFKLKGRATIEEAYNQYYSLELGSDSLAKAEKSAKVYFAINGKI